MAVLRFAAKRLLAAIASKPNSCFGPALRASYKLTFLQENREKFFLTCAIIFQNLHQFKINRGRQVINETSTRNGAL